MSRIRRRLFRQGTSNALVALAAAVAILAAGCNSETKYVAYDTLEYSGGIFLSDGTPFTGVATVTHPDGKPAKEIQLRNGQFHGVVKEWAENGTLIVETHFDDGKRHGKNTYWFPDGRLQKEQVYDHDKVVKEKKHY